jgi:hypothetical protein
VGGGSNDVCLVTVGTGWFDMEKDRSGSGARQLWYHFALTANNRYNRQTDRQTHTQTGRQPTRQTDVHTYSRPSSASLVVEARIEPTT